MSTSLWHLGDASMSSMHLSRRLGGQRTSGHVRRSRSSTPSPAKSMAETLESLSNASSVLLNTISTQSDSLWTIQGKTCIVTGAASGVGFEIALGLVKHGARVVLACQDGDAAEEAVDRIRQLAHLKCDNTWSVSWSHLDLVSLSSVRRFADEILRNYKNLHVLVHNAGTYCPGPRMVVVESGLEKTWATNHFGPFLLTHLLMPMLKSSAPSRIIFVACEAYKKCRRNFGGKGINVKDLQYDLKPKLFDPWKAYCQTMLASILTARTLQWKLNGGGESGVSVFCADPGDTDATTFRRQSRQDWMGLILKHVHAQSAKDGAQCPIYCATQPGLRDESGRYFSKCRVKRLKSFATDDSVATKLWRLSEVKTGLAQHLTEFSDVMYLRNSSAPEIAYTQSADRWSLI